MIKRALSSVYRTSEGNKVHGIFTAPEDRYEGDDMRAPRILRVGANALVESGSIIHAHDGDYLLFLHSRGPGQKRFLAFQVTHQVKWSRHEEVIDPVTKMKTSSFEKTLDKAFPIYVEPHGTIADHGITRTRYFIRSAAGVKVGDKLGDFTVHTLQTVPGASIIGAY